MSTPQTRAQVEPQPPQGTQGAQAGDSPRGGEQPPATPAARQPGRAAGPHPIAQQLARIRLQRHLPQATAAGLAGVARSALDSWENGVHDVKLRHLAAWAHALDYELVLQPRRP